MGEAASRENRLPVLRTNPTAPLKKKEKNVFQATAIAHLGIVNDPLLLTLSLNISSAFDSVCHNTLLMLPSFFENSSGVLAYGSQSDVCNFTARFY